MVEGAGVPTGTPLSDPALIEMISEDPVLRGTHLIAEAWDAAGLYQVDPRQWLLQHFVSRHWPHLPFIKNPQYLRQGTTTSR